MTTMLAEIARDRLVTPSGAAAGDALFLTKGIPIEATAIIANELPERLKGLLTEGELSTAKNYLYSPGISILKDAQIALRSGKITAMHDPTEGGLAGALWELADASQKTLLVDEDSIPVPPLAQKICRHLHINPLAAIASGALLFSASQDNSASILSAFDSEGIICRQIGEIAGGPPEVLSKRPSGNLHLERPSRDEIARLFESP
jgi:hydrogenase maturation factor